MTKSKPSDPSVLGVALPISLTIDAVTQVRGAWTDALTQLATATRSLAGAKAGAAKEEVKHIADAAS